MRRLTIVARWHITGAARHDDTLERLEHRCRPLCRYVGQEPRLAACRQHCVDVALSQKIARRIHPAPVFDALEVARNPNTGMGSHEHTAVTVRAPQVASRAFIRGELTLTCVWVASDTSAVPG